MEILIHILQVVLAIGLINVWIVRFNKKTKYRGGQSENLKEEFSSYGFSKSFFYFIGFLKISLAILLGLGFWFKELILPSSILLSFLMLGAIFAHFKIQDPLLRSLPAVSMLFFSLLLCFCCI